MINNSSRNAHKESDQPNPKAGRVIEHHLAELHMFGQAPQIVWVATDSAQVEKKAA